MNHVQGRISDTRFDSAHIGSEHADTIGQFLLRESFLASELSDAGAKGMSGGIAHVDMLLKVHSLIHTLISTFEPASSMMRFKEDHSWMTPLQDPTRVR